MCFQYLLFLLFLTECSVLSLEEYEINYSGSEQPMTIWKSKNNMSEHVSAATYFTESPSLNSHHLHWHSVVNPDMERFGEIFYYMHRQVLLRYEAERLSSGLNMTQTFCISDWDSPIAEGYDPKLGSWWKPRPSGDVMGTEEERRKIKEQYWVSKEFSHSSGNYSEGIDQGVESLGRLVENTLHNTGHAYLNAMGGNGVMGSAVGALRDPIFYRWHTCIEDIFREYKDSLGPYKDEDLNFEGVEVTNVEVKTDGQTLANKLFTFMETKDIKLRNIDGDLSYDYDQNTSVKTVNIKRLNHHHFQYKLSIHSKMETVAVVRVFLKPSEIPGNKMILEMDHFYIKLEYGSNEIKRDEASAPHITQSGLTLTELQENLMNGLLNKDQFDWDGCGWPKSANVPRGKVGGMAWQLVVMVSSIIKRDQETVEDDWEYAEDYSWAFCGVRNGTLPDSRPLGFPFDRNFSTLSDLMKDKTPKSRRQNWAVVNVTIVHSDGVTLPVP